MIRQWVKNGVIVFLAALCFVSCNPEPEVPEKPKLSLSVIFDYQSEGKKDIVTVKEGDRAVFPLTPEKTGYVFKGWSLDKESETYALFDVNTAITQSITLYARWELPDCIVTLNYYPNNEKEANKIEQVTVKNGDYMEFPQPESLPGYTFLGWSFRKDFMDYWNHNELNKAITENKTFYGYWSKTIQCDTENEEVIRSGLPVLSVAYFSRLLRDNNEIGANIYIFKNKDDPRYAVVFTKKVENDPSKDGVLSCHLLYKGTEEKTISLWGGYGLGGTAYEKKDFSYTSMHIYHQAVESVFENNRLVIRDKEVSFYEGEDALAVRPYVYENGCITVNTGEYFIYNLFYDEMAFAYDLDDNCFFVGGTTEYEYSFGNIPISEFSYNQFVVQGSNGMIIDGTYLLTRIVDHSSSFTYDEVWK